MFFSNKFDTALPCSPKIPAASLSMFTMSLENWGVVANDLPAKIQLASFDSFFEVSVIQEPSIPLPACKGFPAR